MGSQLADRAAALAGRTLAALMGFSLCAEQGAAEPHAPHAPLGGAPMAGVALASLSSPASPSSATEATLQAAPSGRLQERFRGGLAATLLPAGGRCSETVARTADVTLQWSVVPAAGALLQRVQLTKLREGFATGQYLESQDLPLDENLLLIAGPEPGVVYRWRIAVLLPGPIWWTSGEDRFEVPICPGDGV